MNNRLYFLPYLLKDELMTDKYVRQRLALAFWDALLAFNFFDDLNHDQEQADHLWFILRAFADKEE